MKRKGISLIVLIITIVVIIILATAIIVSIAKTNIIDNANEATLKSDVANLKSELEMYVTDQFVATKGKYDREKLNADVGQAKYSEENIEDKNKDGKTNIYDILNSLKNSSLDGTLYIQEGDIIFIRSKFNSSQLKVLAKMGEEIDGKPKITDIVSKSDFTSITVSADVTSPEEVEKYIYILNDGEGVETTESSKTFEGLEPATKYTVTIKALLKDGTEIVMVEEISTLDNTPPVEPVISSSYGYLLLTEYGAVDGGKTTITYDTSEGVINHYSLDNGVTWNEYKEPFYVSEACTIMAKSLKPNGLESNTTKEITIPKDALGEDVFSDDLTKTVAVANTTKKIAIDSSIYGEKIYVDYTSSPTSNSTAGYTLFSFYDTNNNVLSEQKYTSNSRRSIELDVPKDAIYLSIYRYYGKATLYNIAYMNEPVISEVKNYPVLNVNGLESANSEVQISYNKTTVQKLYKINEGDWQNYNSETIKLGIGDKLYAKGIDKNNKETRIVSDYTAQLLTDALDENAFNTDETKTVTVANTTKKFRIDPSMYGEKIHVDYTSSPTSNSTAGYTLFSFYDANNNVLSEDKYTSNSRRSIELIVPKDSVYLAIYRYYGKAVIYNIAFKDEPVISEVKYYPLLTANGVEYAHSKVQISYNKTSIQKLYKINEGDWQNYNGETIKLKIGDKLYAKDIDENNKESRIVSEHVAQVLSDALGEGAFNDDETKTAAIANTTKRFDVDSSIWGKFIKFDYTSTKTSNSNSGYTLFKCHDSSGEVLSENKYSTNYRRTIEFSIPNDTSYITIYRYYGTATIYRLWIEN